MLPQIWTPLSSVGTQPGMQIKAMTNVTDQNVMLSKLTLVKQEVPGDSWE